MLKIRNDPAGGGYFGAPRGGRIHPGLDILHTPGETFRSPSTGEFVRIMWPYSDDISYKGLEIQVGNFYIMRILYVEPDVPLTSIFIGDPIGIVQDITKRYPGQGMKNHVHIEVFLNPDMVLMDKIEGAD